MVVVGAGPAGLMAAEVLARGGARVILLDHMPSPGRKFLMAGRGGLNLTHSEPLEPFLARYGAARPALEPLIRAFPPAALMEWAEGLGQEVFTGSSGRVFPKVLKASPLLRAWLARLGGLGVTLRTRHRWVGWDGSAPVFEAPEGRVTLPAAAVVLALGGASWPRLGADGAWAPLLPGVVPLRPANCGFLLPWSAHFRDRFAGTPLKRIALSHAGRQVRGEAMITATGLEGGAVYALSAALREAIDAEGAAQVTLDLRPDQPAGALAARLDGPRGGQSLANHLRRAGLPPVGIGLVQEARHAGSTAPLSALVKALPLRLTGTAGLDRAISSAGGVGWAEVDARLMLRSRPGVFLAGEMLDWEAPTGGYLLQACLATGVAAGQGALAWVSRP